MAVGFSIESEEELGRVEAHRLCPEKPPTNKGIASRGKRGLRFLVSAGNSERKNIAVGVGNQQSVPLLFRGDPRGLQLFQCGCGI